MTKIQKIISGIEKVELGAIVTLLIAEILLASIVLFLKLIDYAFDTTYLGEGFNHFVQTFLKLTLIWLGFLGASLAISRRKNIAIDLIQQLVALEKRQKLDIIINLVSAAVMGMLFWLSLYYFDFKIMFNLGEKADPKAMTYFEVWGRVVYPLMGGVMVAKFIMTSFTPLEDEKIEEVQVEAS